MAKNKAAYQKLTIIDEEEEPCLRALMRKIRNLNKKLADIKQIQGKEYLKAEQLQKLNRREKYQTERDKYVDFVVAYREILLENQNYYRSKQLQQIDNLAVILAVMQAEGYRKDAQISRQSLMFGGAEEFGEEVTLADLYRKIKQNLENILNCQTIKQSARKYLETHTQEKVKTKVKIVDQSSLSDAQKNKKNDPSSERQPGKTYNQPEQTPHVQQKHKQIKQESQNNAKNNCEDSDKNEDREHLSDAKNVELNSDTKAVHNNGTAKKSQNQNPSLKATSRGGDFDFNQPLSHKSEIINGEGKGQVQQDSDKLIRGGFKSEEKGTDDPKRRRNQNRKRRSKSKQKYQEKAQNLYGRYSRKPHDQEKSSDNSNRPRQFNEKEIKQLKEEGFIVVGKPKPKKTYQNYPRNYNLPRRADRVNSQER